MVQEQELVEVIQADRDAAKRARIVIYTPNEIVAGMRDNTPLVQAFARHRLTSERAARNAAIEECAKVAVQHPAGRYNHPETVKKRIALAIRALSDKGGKGS